LLEIIGVGEVMHFKKCLLYIFILFIALSCSTISEKDYPSWINEQPADTSDLIFFKASVKTSTKSRLVNQDNALSVVAAMIASSMNISQESNEYQDIVNSILFSLKAAESKNLNDAPLESSLTEVAESTEDAVIPFVSDLLYFETAPGALDNYLYVLVVLNRKKYDFYSDFYSFYFEKGNQLPPKNYSALKELVSAANSFATQCNEKDFFLIAKIYSSVYQIFENFKFTIDTVPSKVQLLAENPGYVVGSCSVPGVPVSVRYQVKGAEPGSRIQKQKYLSVGSDGKFRFEIDAADDKGIYSLSFSPDLRGLFPISATGDEKIVAYANSLKKLNEDNVKKVEYEVISMALQKKTGILIYDFDTAGNNSGNFDTANGLEQNLKQKGFSIEVIVSDQDFSGIEFTALIELLKAKYAGVYDRIIVGQASLYEFDDSDSQIFAAVNGKVSVLDLKSGEIIYEKEESTNSRSEEINAAVTLAFRALGRKFAKDFVQNLP
jgi:predicted nucleic acid-binding protein